MAAFSVWILMIHSPLKWLSAPFILMSAESSLFMQHVSTSILVNSFFISEANDMRSRPYRLFLILKRADFLECNIVYDLCQHFVVATVSLGIR